MNALKNNWRFMIKMLILIGLRLNCPNGKNKPLIPNTQNQGS